MLRTMMTTSALTALLIGGAAAQTAQPSREQPQATQPQATQPASPSMKSDTSASMSDAKFINSQGSDQWLSSTFMGVDVIGPDNEKIGDISDILFEKDGRIVGYVVGVGGFLGIGAKNVALAPSSFQVVSGDADRATTGTGSTSARSDHIKLKLNMTKDQLKQAAAFESKREQESKSRAASQPAPGGGANRPAPR